MKHLSTAKPRRGRTGTISTPLVVILAEASLFHSRTRMNSPLTGGSDALGGAGFSERRVEVMRRLDCARAFVMRGEHRLLQIDWFLLCSWGKKHCDTRRGRRSTFLALAAVGSVNEV